MAKTLVTLLVAWTLACGGSQPEPASPSSGEPTSSGPPGTPPPGAQLQGAGQGPVLAPGSEGCINAGYMVGDTCFQEESGACKAAGCDSGKCVVEKSKPAKVSCAKSSSEPALR